MVNKQKNLLSVTSYGYDVRLDAVYKEQGFNVTTTKTLRKALTLIKQLSPDVIVAEFIYAPTYGSQLSNFESLFAAAQTYAPHACFVALSHKDDLQHLERVKTKISCCYVLTLPITASDMAKCLNAMSS